VTTPRTTHEPTAALLAGVAAALQRPVALDPRAVDGVYSAAAFHARASATLDAAAPSFVREGDVAIVGIDGPLAQRAWSCMGMFSGDGYDAIAQRVRAALADAETRAVVLRIDSPGGEVAGLFDAVATLRADAGAAGKPLVAYADEMMCSAAYALACAADRIVAPATGTVGSIGVITVVGDRVAANEAEGLNLRVIRSGALKAVPHPDEALTDAGIAKVQATVDALASVFAQTVATARALPAAAVLALEAECFLGTEAVAKGLADATGNLATAVSLARSLAMPVPASTSTHAGREPAPGDHHMQALIALLGLAASATETDVLARVTALQGASAQLAGLTGKDSASEALGVVQGWKAGAAQAEALATENAKLKSDAEASDRAAIIADAIEDGRLAPGNEALRSLATSLPLDQAKAMLNALPKVVRTESVISRAGEGNAAREPGAVLALTPEDAHVAKLCGLKPEAVAASKRALLAQDAT
jgi:signal peptide peptidase SppA